MVTAYAIVLNQDTGKLDGSKGSHKANFDW